MGIARLLILDLIQEGIHGHGGQQLLRLFHGGQTDARQAAVPNVVKAQEGEIVGNADAVFLRSLENAQGVGIGGGEDGRFPEEKSCFAS